MDGASTKLEEAELKKRRRGSAVPGLADFESTTMRVGSGELFNPPGLTNFLGSLQCAPGIMAIQHLTFPPYSQGDIRIGTLTINETCLFSSGTTIDYKWRPDRIVRRATVDGFKLSTTTVMGVRSQTAVIALTVRNLRSTSRKVSLRIQTGGGVIHSIKGWKTPYSPKEGPSISVTPWEGAPPEESLVENSREVLDDGQGVIYSSVTSDAVSLQALSPLPSGVDRSWLDYDFRLQSGRSRTIYFFVGVAAGKGDLDEDYRKFCDAPESWLKAAELDWRKEIKAVFTPGNDRYSGHLPTLDTSNDALRRIYLATIISVIYFKRIHPDSRYGRTYATIMPRYWVTTSFINDWSMTAYLFAMLDPDCLKKMLSLWFQRDIYSHFGTEYVSGSNSGNWYSCNDYAMTRLVSAYVRVTGDVDWLSEDVAGRRLLDRLCDLATHYKELDRGRGLADYGDRNSLLEAVGAYTHEVASLSAANVWVLREVAELLDLNDEDGRANRLREMADELIPEIQKLYVEGEGYWCCRQPDGELVPVRHAWDFVHVLNFLSKDLPARQIREMVRFFEDELMTPAWMSALSPLDEDIGFSLRLDHEWNGSWPGWVALATSGLMRAGRSDLLARWLPGLARSTNQGPFSQAHFIEKYAPPFDGGARKGPTEWPYINDWAAMCVGGFFETILYDLFGLDHRLKGDLTASPMLEGFDVDATLDNVPHHGDLYSVNLRDGM